MRRFVLLTSLLLSAVSPLTEAGKSIPLRIVRSPLPPAGRSSEGYKHPWYEYVTADISFGSTLQTFLMDFSTTTSDLVINFCNEHPAADPASCFDSLLSTSYQNVSMEVGSDFVSFGEYWNVSRQEFLSTSKGVNERGFFGVVGASPSPLASYGITPFWLNALKDNEPKNQFGIFVSHDGQNSFLRFGGPLLASQCDLSSLQWFSLSSDKYWQTPISGFNFGGYKGASTSTRSWTPAAGGSDFLEPILWT